MMVFFGLASFSPSLSLQCSHETIRCEDFHGVLVAFVALAHAGNVPRLNMAIPHVLMPRLMLKMPMMLRMKPAFAFKQKENTITHNFFP